MPTALLERVGRLADTLTAKTIIRKEAPQLPTMCVGLGRPCDVPQDCCPLVGIEICILGICALP